MQASTYYGNDIFGCVKANISVPDTNGKLDLAIRSVQLWGWNPLQNGQIHAESYELDHKTTGVLTYKTAFVLDTELYKILDTDYTTYAIVYQCSRNAPFVLNYFNDDVHIFTRTETVLDADLTTYKTTAETKIGVSGFASKFETLDKGACKPTDYQTKLFELFTDPDNFFRKW